MCRGLDGGVWTSGGHLLEFKMILQKKKKVFISSENGWCKSVMIGSKENVADYISEHITINEHTETTLINWA